MDVSNLLNEVEGRLEIAYEVLRIYLGLGLLARGALFAVDPSLLQGYLAAAGADWAWPSMLAHAVVMAHLGGGLLLTVGLATRVAAAVQVPVVFGAVFFVHLPQGLGAGQSLELSALVLVMLLIFTAFGGGAWSADRWLANEYRKREAGAPLRAVVPAVHHHHIEALFEDDADAWAALEELKTSGVHVAVEVHRGELADAEMVRMGLGERLGRGDAALVIGASVALGAAAVFLMPLDMGLTPLMGAAIGLICGTAYVLAVGFTSVAPKPRFAELVDGVRAGGTLVSVDVDGDDEEVAVTKILSRHHPSSSQHLLQ